MAKGKKSGGDYEGWILRLIEKVEDFQYAYSEQSWLDFAAGKIVPIQGYDLTELQEAVLLDKRDMVFEEIPERLGIQWDVMTQYRVKGRFATADTPGARSYTVVGFRDTGDYGGRPGEFLSRRAINERIEDAKAERSWDKL